MATLEIGVKITVLTKGREATFGSSYWEVRKIEGSRYWDSTALQGDCIRDIHREGYMT